MWTTRFPTEIDDHCRRVHIEEHSMRHSRQRVVPGKTTMSHFRHESTSTEGDPLKADRCLLSRAVPSLYGEAQYTTGNTPTEGDPLEADSTLPLSRRRSFHYTGK